MKDMGSPFQEIDGPGVELVEAMTQLEDLLRDMGIEVEYKVEDEAEFRWPEIGST